METDRGQEKLTRLVMREAALDGAERLEVILFLAGVVVQHVADAVGQDRPPSERVRLRRHRSILCISHGECWLGSTATTAFDQLQL